MRWVATIAALLGATCGSLVACIIPDTHLQVRGEAVNPGPVRLVQATEMTPEAEAACKGVQSELGSCPMVPATLPFGLVRPETGDFCVCPELDGRALNYFDIYAEDPDLDGQDRPKDSIFGVFLLDMPSEADDPPSYVAYEHLLSPTTPAVLQQFGIGSYADAIERPEPLVRRWTIGDAETQVDLCNDNASSPSSKLEPRLHSLRLIVTDRPWYRAFQRTASGEIALDEHDDPIQVPAEEAAIGVPDTPGGASYAVADYVFRCRDGVPPVSDLSCECAEAEAPQ
ncbi:MAG: hypothetical protein IAG13_36445 [Deltaproteobacteria bacterium]|nr:hypothetical protein [Nannocystaceae bacterium]